MLNLDYPNFEIIAVDDRSSDNSFKIMEKLKRKQKPTLYTYNTMLSLP